MMRLGLNILHFRLLVFYPRWCQRQFKGKFHRFEGFFFYNNNKRIFFLDHKGSVQIDFHVVNSKLAVKLFTKFQFVQTNDKIRKMQQYLHHIRLPLWKKKTNQMKKKKLSLNQQIQNQNLILNLLNIIKPHHCSNNR